MTITPLGQRGPLDDVPAAVDVSHDAVDRHRWAILAVVCVAVFDGTIVNIALPSLSGDLGAPRPRT
jgi:hypothetical protein